MTNDLAESPCREAGVLPGHPDGQGDRPIGSAGIPHRALDQVGALAEQRALIGMADERQHAVADEPDRGLEAGNEEADRL